MTPLMKDASPLSPRTPISNLERRAHCDSCRGHFYVRHQHRFECHCHIHGISDANLCPEDSKDSEDFSVMAVTPPNASTSSLVIASYTPQITTPSNSSPALVLLPAISIRKRPRARNTTFAVREALQSLLSSFSSPAGKSDEGEDSEMNHSRPTSPFHGIKPRSASRPVTAGKGRGMRSSPTTPPFKWTLVQPEEEREEEDQKDGQGMEEVD